MSNKPLTLARQFKAKRTADYASVMEFVELVESVDANAVFGKNNAGHLQIWFRDGSTYVVGRND